MINLMSLRQYRLYKEYLLLPPLFVAVTVKCRLKTVNETDHSMLKGSKLVENYSVNKKRERI